MVRRKSKGLLDELSELPWYVPFGLGILGFLFVRGAGGLLAPLAPACLVACWLAALVSFVKARKRSELFDRQTGLDTLTAMSWREFEMLVGEAFRRQGYLVEETGLGGADGGIDLILRKNGSTELVQCKQWRSRQIKPAVVREMWGLVDHHRADGAKIVCVGEFTQDAAAFAQGKAIELISGTHLLSMIREVQGATHRPARGEPTDLSQTPPCPSCGQAMVRRINRRSGETFWGCAAYPRCKGTRAA